MENDTNWELYYRHLGTEQLHQIEWPIDAAALVALKAELKRRAPTVGQEHGAPRQQVIVTDIDMPFLSMVGFMVKWAIASIPAFLILFLLGVIIVGFLAGIAGYDGLPR